MKSCPPQRSSLTPIATARQPVWSTQSKSECDAMWEEPKRQEREIGRPGMKKHLDALETFLILLSFYLVTVCTQDDCHLLRVARRCLYTPLNHRFRQRCGYACRDSALVLA